MQRPVASTTLGVNSNDSSNTGGPAQSSQTTESGRLFDEFNETTGEANDQAADIEVLQWIRTKALPRAVVLQVPLSFDDTTTFYYIQQCPSIV